jgi:PKD repeat protein
MKISHILLILIMFLVSCSSSKTTVSQSFDYTNYQYATVINENHHSHTESMGTEMKIYDAIDNSRLQLVGGQAISELSQEQKQKLLIARYSATVTELGATVTVNFVDYYTGRPLVSCQGEYSKGLDNNADLTGAIKLVADQIVKTFSKE